MFKKLLLLASLIVTPALAQSVQQSGTVTPRQVPVWVTSGVIGGSQSAPSSSTDSVISSLGVTNNGGAGFCVSSDRLSAAGRNQLCFGASTAGAGVISLQNYGTANPQNLNFVINGTAITIPTGGGTFLFGNGPFGAGHVPCFINSAGVVQDCGLTLSNGTITAGTWQGAPVDIPFGGTNATSASGARTNLGLGTIATQNANNVALTGGTATGFPSPTNASDVAIKSYVDAVSSGLNILAPSRLATAAVLPNTPTYANGTLGVGATLTSATNTTLTVDGTSTALNDVILVKNQASAFQNGIYTQTQVGTGSVPWILTRATYFDQAAEMKAGSYTFVSAGATNINSSYTLQTAVTTVGTDPLNFVQFSAAASGTVTSAAIAAGTGISVAGTCTITNTGTCTVTNTGVTQVVAGTGLDGGTINTTGTVSLSAARRTLPTSTRLTSGTNLTYTTPANALWIEITMIGSGGGGNGVGGGGGGTDTCWNTSGTACTSPVYDAGAGKGSAGAPAGGLGGTVSGSSTCNNSAAGGNGTGGSAGAAAQGGSGGASSLGGNGGGANGQSATATAGQPNTGGGGGGGTSGTQSFPGGGAGATCYAIIGSPAATYTYTVGQGGSAGTTGGAAGASGNILIIEHYGS